MLSAENAPTFQPSNNSSNRNRNTHRFSYKDANNALLIPPSDSEFIFPTLKVDSLALYFAQKPEFVSSIYYEACYDLESESDSTKSYKMSKNTTSPSIPKSPTVTTPSNPTLPKSSTHRKVSILTQLGRFALYLIFTLTLLFTIYLASPTKKGPAGKKKQPKEYLDEIAFYKTRVELALNICLVLGAVGAIVLSARYSLMAFFIHPVIWFVRYKVIGQAHDSGKGERGHGSHFVVDWNCEDEVSCE